MIYKNINEESYLDRMPITIINGKRYGRNPLPSDFPKTDKLLYDNEEINVALVKIPREYARENKHFNPYEIDIDTVECYELFLYHQVGEYMITKKDTYAFIKLPSGKLVNIILYHDGGVEFDPAQRKYVLREYDELDRRIILGFCIKHQEAIKNTSHKLLDNEDSFGLEYLRHKAIGFNEKDLNKRLKTGRTGIYARRLDAREPKPYEEMGIFSEVVFLNA